MDPIARSLSNGDIREGEPTSILPVVDATTDGVWRVIELAPDGSLVLHPNANAPGEGIVSLRVEGTPGSFFHLVAELERQSGDVKVLGITSAILGEGKTTIALHLARSISGTSYRSVCLLDLSLGEDDLCRRVGAAPAPGGVIGFLESGEPIYFFRWPGSADLSLVPAGKAPRNAARTARSPRIGDLIHGLRETFDLVIVDLPAVSTDNLLPLLKHIDSVAVVMRAGATPRGILQEAIEKIGRDNVAGVVLNRVEQRKPAKGAAK